ncbi:non-specific lipid transfer protein GPI-anchored 14-like [Primulina tabacum]|uniref:non-specific lipid transfer protein GPI-anchored 14-like n=1 Tax=Primulina tabacum TaxID=48773 RepID=UPI003F5A8AB6
MDSNYPISNIMKPSLVLLLSMLILCPLAAMDDAKDREECKESLLGLAPCLPYVQGTGKAPTPDCCGGLKQVLKTNKKCLCVIVKDRNDPNLDLNINVTLALGLPQVCSAPANISQCPELLKLPPDSPEAQVFYQFGKQSSNGTRALAPTPSNAPTGATAAPQKSAGACNIGKKWPGMEIILAGLVVVLLGIHCDEFFPLLRCFVTKCNVLLVC